MRRSVTPRARAATSSSYTRWAIRGARPADGSSTSSSTGSFTSSFASDSIFASPPPLSQAWKRRVGALEDGRDAGAIVPSDPGAELEILLDRQLRKDVLPLGDVADSEPLDRVGRESLDLPPAVEDPATPRMEEAKDRLQQRRLARA